MTFGKITSDFVIRDYESIKIKIKKLIDEESFENAFVLISTAAKIAYETNFKYSDDELENLLSSISNLALPKVSFTSIKNRFVFYDYFSLDNRGLTQQYISSLKSWGFDFLYIVESQENLKYAQNIMKELGDISGAEVFVMPEGLSQVEKACITIEKISRYRPEKAFLHIAPWSALAISIWNVMPSVVRYYIDITDHAFWLGKSCSDYFIGWRDYGSAVAMKYRGIPPDKLLQQTYYPIINDFEFQGFPHITQGKTIILSGGSYYKVYGENDLFFGILKRIVCENENCVILFAGSGNDEPFRRFINSNYLQNKIILIGNRVDINQVFEHCDIYLNTYPFIGGLMSQYAIINRKPLIGYTSKDYAFNFSEEVFLPCPDVKFSFTDLNEFHREINLLINDPMRRKYATKNYGSLIPSKYEYQKSLLELIENNKQDIKEKMSVAIDVCKIMQLYLAIENEYMHVYHINKFRRLRILYFRLAPLDALLSISYMLCFNRKEFFKVIFKKLIN